MQITTKFDTNQTVYFVADNRIVQAEVDGISIECLPMSALADVGAAHIKVGYSVRSERLNGSRALEEDQLFASAQECADELVRSAE